MIEFLVHEGMESRSRAPLQDKQLYVTCEQKCYHSTKEIAYEVAELEATQEDGDTRLSLHVAQCGFKTVSSLLKTQMYFSYV